MRCSLMLFHELQKMFFFYSYKIYGLLAVLVSVELKNAVIPIEDLDLDLRTDL